MVSDETMMFRFGAERESARSIILHVKKAMEEKGYNPINQLVGYLTSGDPAYITSHMDARNRIRTLERDDILEELVRFYLDQASDAEKA